MILEKQIVQGIFGPGGHQLNTGRDPKVLGLDLTLLENGHFDREGAISKRCGAANISGVTDKFITKYKERPVAIGTGTLKVFDGAAGGTSGTFDTGASTIGWADIEPAVMSSIKGAVYFYPDITVLGNVLCCVFTAYKLVSGSYSYVPTCVTFDATTGLQIDSQELDGASAATVRHARCQVLGNQVLVYYIGSNNHIWWHTVDTAGAISNSGTDGGGAAVDTSKTFDVGSLDDPGSTVGIVFRDASGIVLQLYTGGVTLAVTVTLTAHTYAFVGCFNWGTNRLCLVYHDVNDAHLYAKAYNAAGSVVVAETTIWHPATNSVYNCTGISQTANRAVIYWTAQLSTYDYVVYMATLDDTPSATAGAEYLRRARLAGKAFDGVADPSVLIHYEAKAATGEVPSQSAYYLCDSSGRIIGKAFVGRAGPNAPAGETVLSHVSTVIASGSGWVTCGLVRTSKAANPWADGPYRCLYDDIGFAKLTILKSIPSSLKTEERSVLCIPNSNPYQWDGQKLVEQGFLQYPEGITVDTSTAGSLTGTWGYKFCYESTDLQGNVERSAPSPSISATVTGKRIDLTVPTLTFTRRTSVKIVCYRTENGGSTWYRHSDKDNDPTAASVTFQDNTADADLANRAMVYTTGGVVENIQPQPYRVHCMHQSRHFIVDRERESTTIWYTRRILEGEAIPYNDVLQLLVPEEGGAITALASFMDRLIVFKENRIYAVTGDGPDDCGNLSQYSEPFLVSPVIGCSNQKTLARIPAGLAFVAARGIYLLDGNMQVGYLGKRAQRQTDTLTPVAAAVISDKGYVVWLCSATAAIVYNYVFDQWATFVGDYAVALDGVECNGILYWTTGSAVKVENRSSYLDNTSDITLKLRTGWISGQLLGWLRLYKLVALGQNIVAHKLRLKIASNMEPNWVEQRVFSTATMTAFDFSLYFGTFDAAYAGQGYIVQAVPQYQKKTSWLFEVSDERPASSPINEALSITALALLVGVEKGTIRRGSTRWMTTP